MPTGGEIASNVQDRTPVSVGEIVRGAKFFPADSDQSLVGIVSSYEDDPTPSNTEIWDCVANPEKAHAFGVSPGEIIEVQDVSGDFALIFSDCDGVDIFAWVRISELCEKNWFLDRRKDQEEVKNPVSFVIFSRVVYTFR
jgi:hypothetical protein